MLSCKSNKKIPRHTCRLHHPRSHFYPRMGLGRVGRWGARVGADVAVTVAVADDVVVVVVVVAVVGGGDACSP